ncbi:MAG TPA: hypothetical protein VFV50_15890, partial [Bdellovibrionales bacterium]|nr:hypothetical protein [Bdellovibrionales bacterium]
MNSFRLLVVFYVLIIASLALGTDDFNSGTPDTAVERPRPPARPRRPSRQPNRVEPARRAQPRPAPLYNPIPPATPPSLVTDPTH